MTHTLNIQLDRRLIEEAVKNETFLYAQTEGKKNSDTPERYQRQAGDEQYHQRILEKNILRALNKLVAQFPDAHFNLFADSRTIDVAFCISKRFNRGFRNTVAQLASDFIEDEAVARWYHAFDSEKAKVYQKYADNVLESIKNCFVKVRPRRPEDENGNLVTRTVREEPEGRFAIQLREEEIKYDIYQLSHQLYRARHTDNDIDIDERSDKDIDDAIRINANSIRRRMSAHLVCDDNSDHLRFVIKMPPDWPKFLAAFITDAIHQFIVKNSAKRLLAITTAADDPTVIRLEEEADEQEAAIVEALCRRLRPLCTHPTPFG